MPVRIMSLRLARPEAWLLRIDALLCSPSSLGSLKMINTSLSNPLGLNTQESDRTGHDPPKAIVALVPSRFNFSGLGMSALERNQGRCS